MPYGTSVPFRAETEGYSSFRIPALVRAPDGALLAFAEGRVNSSEDCGDIDIVSKRSTDGGLNWEPLRVVAQMGDGTAGNPAPVFLEEGRLVLVFVSNAADATEERIRRGEVAPEDGRRVWVQHSDDHGFTWSDPREITEQVKRSHWRWYATTPGHAIQLASGPHAGRIVVPGNHSIPPTGGDNGTEGKYDGGHSLLSDDGGETWRIGYSDNKPDGYVNINETACAELPNGQVYFNARAHGNAPGSRATTRSLDGGETLAEPFHPEPALLAPVVEGSVLQLHDPDVLLFAAPEHPMERVRMVIHASDDNGGTWWTAHTVDSRPAAYSDLVRVDKDTVGLLYETGDNDPYETLTFRQIPAAKLR